MILDTLHFCMFSVDTQQALDAKALPVFTDLLKHQTPSIRSKAARDIFDITYASSSLSRLFTYFIISIFDSIPLQGKMEALELETVPSLVQLLKDQDVYVRAKAALALES